MNGSDLGKKCCSNEVKVRGKRESRLFGPLLMESLLILHRRANSSPNQSVPFGMKQIDISATDHQCWFSSAHRLKAVWLTWPFKTAFGRLIKLASARSRAPSAPSSTGGTRTGCREEDGDEEEPPLMLAAAAKTIKRAREPPGGAQHAKQPGAAER